jgi:hypothetical protein
MASFRCGHQLPGCLTPQNFNHLSGSTNLLTSFLTVKTRVGSLSQCRAYGQHFKPTKLGTRQWDAEVLLASNEGNDKSNQEWIFLRILGTHGKSCAHRSCMDV